LQFALNTGDNMFITGALLNISQLLVNGQ